MKYKFKVFEDRSQVIKFLLIKGCVDVWKTRKEGDPRDPDTIYVEEYIDIVKDKTISELVAEYDLQCYLLSEE